MATANKFGDTLNANFKEKYADKIKNLIPEGLKLYKAIKFMAKEKQPGNLYHQPVILGLEHGVTFASSDDDAFNLNAPVAGQIKDAQVRGNPLVLRSVLGYMAAQRAASGKEGAFEDATKFLVANMLRSISKKLEIEMLYGQMGYGIVSSIAANVITLTTPSFAAGIWVGGENMPIEIRDTTGATIRGECVISSVDLDARTLTVNAAPAAVAATDVIWHKGAYGNEFAGIHKILTNTGTLFNISATTYSLWKGNSQSAGSTTLSLATVERAVVKAVNKGLESDVTVYVNVGAWNDLLTEQAAKRSYDQSYSSAQLESGAKALKFYGINGQITVEPSIYVKEGFAYVLCLEDWMKVGSTDVTFKRPNGDGEFFRELENSAGVELRCLADVAVFCMRPGCQSIITLIINS